MQNTDFLVGLGKANISPVEPVALQGYGDDRMRISDGVLVQLYSMCLAVRDDEGNTAIIISVDAGSIEQPICDLLRDSIQQATGLSRNNVLITAIHQHSTPSWWALEVESTLRYRKYFIEKTTQAAVEALADLSAAEMFIARVQTEGLTFVKHYLMKDGTYAGDVYGTFKPGIERHESEADSTLQLVKIKREGKRDILLCNFQGHPHRDNGGDNYRKANANMPGAFREEAEKLLHCDVIYVSGAQGNLNMHSRIKEEMKTPYFMEDGKALAQYAVQAEGTYEKINGGKVQATICNYTGRTDHSMDDLLEEAKRIAHVWQTQVDKAAAMALATSGRVHSVYHAEAIIEKQAQGPTRQLDLMAVSFGDVAICGGPYEMFDTNGMEIKEGSPFAMTFTANMVNGTIGYVPSQMSFEHGCYPADITRFAPGSGEEFRNVFLKILGDQRAAQ